MIKHEFHRFVERIQSTFEAEVYAVDIRTRPDAVVQSASIGFPGQLHELGLPPHTRQKLSIKVEVDTNPPANADHGLPLPQMMLVVLTADLNSPMDPEADGYQGFETTDDVNDVDLHSTSGDGSGVYAGFRTAEEFAYTVTEVILATNLELSKWGGVFTDE